MSKNKPLPPLKNTPFVSPGEAAGVKAKSETPPTAYDHCAFFCQAIQERFDEMAKGMAEKNWELVAVLPHRKYITTGGGNGYSDGWMTFWKRIRMSKDDK